MVAWIFMPTPVSTGPPIIDFAPFRLDLRAGQLRRDAIPVRLRPKTFAVLEYLVERPGELVTKQALLDAVWGDVAVSEDVVRLSVGELRAALGDERVASRFIETVPRRGYRFIARMGAERTGSIPAGAETAVEDSSAAHGTVVGRQRERAEIAAWLGAATSGRRQIGFVAGEAGIGKTTLVDLVLSDLRRTHEPRLRIARGQCVEHYGGGEPYLPVLEAIEDLRRASDRPHVEGSLRTHAPTWLVRVMGLHVPGELDRAEPAPGTHEHTLHRLAASLEALAAEIPLVLVLEDVQWSDYSTLDLLSVLAQRREAARLLVLCTLRPADAIVRGHPVAGLKRELMRKGVGREILLDGLSPADVASYLAARFRGARLPEDLLSILVDRSEGNPFFVVALVDHLLEQRLLVDDGNGWQFQGGLDTLRTTIPDGLHAVIEPRLERLAPDELRMLEAASVAGAEFASHALACIAPRGSDVAEAEHVEQVCDGLVRRQEFLRAAGERLWPDGTMSSSYAFRHALYQQVIYGRLSPSARRRLHQTIGESLEKAYGGRPREVAAELAAHFARSRDVERAVRYHGEAAAHASSRFAYEETRFHLEGALVALRSQPESSERLRREMELLENLGWTLFSLRGFGDEGAAQAFARLRDLGERLDAPEVRLRAMQSLLTVHTMRAEHPTARTLGEEMIAIAERVGDRLAAENARPTLGAALMHLGELEAAHDHAEQGRASFDAEAPTLHGISSCLLLASTCAHLGLAARARAVNREAVALTEKLRLPYIRAHATTFAATIYQVLRDVADTRSFAEETVRLATECGFSIFRITATIYLGWCDVQEGRVGEGLAAASGAFDQYTKSGQRISTTSYALLVAEAHLANGDVTAANQVLDDALAFAEETGERLYEHELYRLKGECLLSSTATNGRKTQAIEYLERALQIAADRKALLFELRAATSLYRVRKSARERLARIVDRLGAENECADLHAARALLGIEAERKSS
jgi:DNA-binding winged helix-turn-helix (wHTH) protein/tetratricopeptide (TPR) repeat protein